MHFLATALVPLFPRTPAQPQTPPPVPALKPETDNVASVTNPVAPPPTVSQAPPSSGNPPRYSGARLYADFIKTVTSAGVAVGVAAAVYPSLMTYPYTIRERAARAAQGKPPLPYTTTLRNFVTAGPQVWYANARGMLRVIGPQYGTKWGVFMVANAVTGATDENGKVVNPFTVVANGWFAGYIDAMVIRKQQAVVAFKIGELAHPQPGVSVTNYRQMVDYFVSRFQTATPVAHAKLARQLHHAGFTAGNMPISMLIDEATGWSKKYGVPGLFASISAGTALGIAGSEIYDRQRVLSITNAMNGSNGGHIWTRKEVTRHDLFGDHRADFCTEFRRQPLRTTWGIFGRGFGPMAVAYTPFFVGSFVGVQIATPYVRRVADTLWSRLHSFFVTSNDVPPVSDAAPPSEGHG